MKPVREQKVYTVRLPDHIADQVDHYAEKMGLSANQLLNRLIEIGVDDLRLLNSVGLLVVGKGIRDLVDKIRHGEIKLNGQRELEI
ncbi:MAG: hypothetical protein ACWGQW_16735 [bacterium]